MKDIVLETTLLSKSYQQAIALDKVSLTLERGGIYGFVGQNGAGKTTFMRLVAGLTFPDQGEIKLFGSTGEKALAKERKRMGTIIETPAFYPYLTARENMEAMRLSGGIANKNALDRSLELVGLQDTGQKKIQDFSMGMKQRLGIALALLGEPEFLMLENLQMD